MKLSRTHIASALRKGVRKGHLWLGLLLGAVWAVQGATGALLVFHREFDRMALAETSASAPLSLDRLIGAAQRNAAVRAESIGIIDGSARILTVNYTDRSGDRRSVLVDAATGAVLKDRAWRPVSPADGNLTRWIYTLHHQLLAGDAGAYMLGLSGLFLAISLAWGLWLGWPRRQHWKALLNCKRWKAPGQRLYGWHRLVGMLAAPLLVLLALSGAGMDFSKELRYFSMSALSYRTPYDVRSGTIPDQPISVDLASRTAARALPSAGLVSVTLPSAQKPVYQVRMRQVGEWRSWSGTSVVTLNASTGVVVDIYDATKAPLANRILESAFAVHSGEVAGMTGRLAVMMAGFALPALYVLGVLSWLRRKRGARLTRGVVVRCTPE